MPPKLNLQVTAVRGPAAVVPTTVPEVAAEEETNEGNAPVTPDADVAAVPPVEAKKADGPLELNTVSVVEKAEKTPGKINIPQVSKSDVIRIEVEMPKLGARFRFVKTDRTLGEFDSLKDVQKWILDNHQDPTRIEVMIADGSWINFDKVKV